MFNGIIRRNFSIKILNKVNLDKIYQSHNKMKNIVINTPLEFNSRLSQKYNCNNHLHRRKQPLPLR